LNKYSSKVRCDVIREWIVKAKNKEEAIQKMEEGDIFEENVIEEQDYEILEGPELIEEI
jgi:hypothetical protein